MKPLPKTKNPKIGFCGQVASNKIRQNITQSLAKSSLDTNFIIRGKFWGGLSRKDIVSRSSLFDSRRSEFLRNILATHYTLCIRGCGNFSIRLSETMALGRIPLIVDTDCAMPFWNHIDWKDIALWVKPSQVKDVAEIVKNHYNSLDGAELKAKQRQCRRIWVNWLSLSGFCKNLRKLL